MCPKFRNWELRQQTGFSRLNGGFGRARRTCTVMRVCLCRAASSHPLTAASVQRLRHENLLKLQPCHTEKKSFNMPIPIQNLDNLNTRLLDQPDLHVGRLLDRSLTVIWVLPCFILTMGHPSVLSYSVDGYHRHIKCGIREKMTHTHTRPHTQLPLQFRINFLTITFSFSLIAVQKQGSLAVEMSEPLWFNEQQLCSGCYKCGGEEEGRSTH